MAEIRNIWDIIIQTLSILGIGSIITGVLTVLLKHFFDYKKKQREIFDDTFKKFSEITSDYYLPMAIVGGRVGNLLKDLCKDKQIETEYVFFVLASFYRRVLYYIIHGGSQWMYNREDNRNAAILYSKANEEMKLSYNDVSIMQEIAEECYKENSNKTDSLIPYLCFKKKLEEEKELKIIFKKFKEWTKSKDNLKKVSQYFKCYKKYMWNTITDLCRLV